MSGFEFGLCLIMLTASALSAPEALFHDQLVVSVQEKWHGPRGTPGDIIELQDGRLLPACDPHGCRGRRERDRAVGAHSDDPKILGLNLARLLGIPVGEGRGGSPEN